MRHWKLHIDAWPGPDRKKWPGLRDVIQESPAGRYAGVVYSCGEVSMCKETGLFALLAGPPDSPQLLLRPRGLTCLVRYGGTTVQWIGERFCVVAPYSMRRRWFGKPQPLSGVLYFDVEQRMAAYVPGASSAEAVSALPEGLAWSCWKRLSQWPGFWHKR